MSRIGCCTRWNQPRKARKIRQSSRDEKHGGLSKLNEHTKNRRISVANVNKTDSRSFSGSSSGCTVRSQSTISGITGHDCGWNSDVISRFQHTTTNRVRSRLIRTATRAAANRKRLSKIKSSDSKLVFALFGVLSVCLVQVFQRKNYEISQYKQKQLVIGFESHTRFTSWESLRAEVAGIAWCRQRCKSEFRQD